MHHSPLASGSGTYGKAIVAVITARQEVAFQVGWRKSRGQSMQPWYARFPSASERFEALKAWLCSKGAV